MNDSVLYAKRVFERGSDHSCAHNGISRHFTLFARTRKIPNPSSIAHCVTILRRNTRCKAVTESAEQQTSVHGRGINPHIESRYGTPPKALRRNQLQGKRAHQGRLRER